MADDKDALTYRLMGAVSTSGPSTGIDRLLVEAHSAIEGLTAERDRLREAANVLAAVRADAMWLARLARGSSWPGEMAHRVEVAAERVLSLLGESPVPDEPTAHAPETVPVGRYGLDHEALHVDIDSTIHLACNSDGRDDAHCDWVADLTSEIVRLLTAPSHPTGEERTDGV